MLTNHTKKVQKSVEIIANFASAFKPIPNPIYFQNETEEVLIDDNNRFLIVICPVYNILVHIIDVCEKFILDLCMMEQKCVEAYCNPCGSKLGCEGDPWRFINHIKIFYYIYRNYFIML